MSKPNSGLFQGTTGSINLNTSIVWNHIESTQDNYPGTELPRSFNINTSQGKMWTHGNATKHINEAILSIKDNPMLKNSNPRLYSQFILYDYWKNLNNSVKNEIKYETLINNGNWEFIFSKPRIANGNPVVKHARFIGLK